MLRQYVYFCTSKASKLSTKILGNEPIRRPKRKPGDAASVCVLLY
jgi:hypothetical protein